MFNILSAINKSPFDPYVEKATSESNTSEDWQLILEINDRVVAEPNGPKDCLRSIVNRFYTDLPWVMLQALTLLDSLVSNCGKRFHLEVCSRDFENELIRLIKGGKGIHAKVSERARLLLKKWAQSKDFKKDPQLSLIPSLYDRLKSEGISFHSSEPNKRKPMDESVLKNPDYVANAEEEANVAKAIELSIQEAKKRGIKTDSISVTSAVTSSSSSTNNQSSSGTGSSTTSTTSSLYPSFNLSELNNTNINKAPSDSAKEPIKVRALYDFEAAEDNELTFKAGEIILVSDSSNANWWKGSNHRGEGLFPANFVSTDLNAEPENYKTNETKKVQFNEEVKVVKVEKEELKPEDVTVDEEKIDELMSMLQEADTKSFEDPEELLRLEEQCLAMNMLIDQQMEEIDKRNAMLTSLNQQLNSALNLYHDLMKEGFVLEQMASLQLQQGHQSMTDPNVIAGSSYPQYMPIAFVASSTPMVNGVYDPQTSIDSTAAANYYNQIPQPQQPLQLPASTQDVVGQAPQVNYGSPVGHQPTVPIAPNVYQSPTHPSYGNHQMVIGSSQMSTQTVGHPVMPNTQLQSQPAQLQQNIHQTTNNMIHHNNVPMAVPQATATSVPNLL